MTRSWEYRLGLARRDLIVENADKAIPLDEVETFHALDYYYCRLRSQRIMEEFLHAHARIVQQADDGEAAFRERMEEIHGPVVMCFGNVGGRMRPFLFPAEIGHKIDKEASERAWKKEEVR